MGNNSTISRTVTIPVQDYTVSSLLEKLEFEITQQSLQHNIKMKIDFNENTKKITLVSNTMFDVNKKDSTCLHVLGFSNSQLSAQQDNNSLYVLEGRSTCNLHGPHLVQFQIKELENVLQNGTIGYVAMNTSDVVHYYNSTNILPKCLFKPQTLKNYFNLSANDEYNNPIQFNSHYTVVIQFTTMEIN